MISPQVLSLALTSVPPEWPAEHPAIAFRSSQTDATNTADQSQSRAVLTVAEASQRFGVSESWFYHHWHELPHLRIGGSIRFDAALLHRHFQLKFPLRTKTATNPERRTMGLRRFQRGSVVKQGKKVKVWYGIWREDVRQPDGGFVRCKRKVRLGTVSEFPTRTLAYEELARRMNVKPTTALTFSELYERWERAIAPTIKLSTLRYYQKELRVHVLPVFGSREISTISRSDVEYFLADRAKLYCRNTLRGMRVSLGRVLSWAVACDWIPKNPCAGVALPQAGKRVKRTILKPEQVLSIAAELEEPYATLVLFLASTGLRISEAAAIRWEDFDGDVLHIHRRLYEGQVDSPKTPHSERYLPIPESLMSRLRALGGTDWVFRSNVGTPINPGNALRRYVRPVVSKLGINIGGWHDFRHTLTTRLRKLGWAPKVISQIVGHSSIRVTEEIYDHADSDDFRSALGDIADQLKGTAGRLEPNAGHLEPNGTKSAFVN